MNLVMNAQQYCHEAGLSRILWVERNQEILLWGLILFPLFVVVVFSSKHLVMTFEAAHCANCVQ